MAIESPLKTCSRLKGADIYFATRIGGITRTAQVILIKIEKGKSALVESKTSKNYDCIPAGDE